jgi:hypothetical protein
MPQIKLTTVDEFKAMLRPAKGKARGKHTPGEMNKTEAEYAGLLELRKRAGEIVNYQFEAVTVKLAHDCRFTADFFIEHPSGAIECVDVKGSGPIQEDSIIKIRLAAKQFPRWTFAIERKRKKKDGGGFERKEFRA